MSTSMKSAGTLEVAAAHTTVDRLVVEDYAGGRKVSIVLDHATVRYLVETLKEWADRRVTDAALTREVFR